MHLLAGDGNAEVWSGLDVTGFWYKLGLYFFRTYFLDLVQTLGYSNRIDALIRVPRGLAE